MVLQEIKAKIEAQEFYKLIEGYISNEITVISKENITDTCENVIVQKDNFNYQIRLNKDSYGNILKAELNDCTLQGDKVIINECNYPKRVMQFNENSIEVFLSDIKNTRNNKRNYKVIMDCAGQISDTIIDIKKSLVKPHVSGRISHDLITAVLKKLRQRDRNIQNNKSIDHD